MDNFVRAWKAKYWRNVSGRCNGVTHPDWFSYRPYRRGGGRCSVCGAKIGKIKCVRQSFAESTRDFLLKPHSFYEALKENHLISYA